MGALMRRATPLALLLAALPLAAQEVQELPEDLGTPKRRIEIASVDASGEGDHWRFAIEGTSDLEEGAVISLVLNYPAVDPTLKRGVAFSEATLAEGRFAATIEFQGQVLFPGIYEAMAIYNGVNQPDETKADDPSNYHTANKLFLLGSSEEGERTEGILRSYYYVLTGLLYRYLIDLGRRHDELVERVWNEETRRFDDRPEGTFDEAAWRKWMDGDYRPRVEQLSELLRARRDALVAPRFPNALNDAEALARTALELSWALSARIYRAHGKTPDARDARDAGGSGSPEDKWSYALDLVRSIETETKTRIIDRPAESIAPPGLVALLEPLRRAVDGRKPDALAGWTEGIEPREVADALGALTKSGQKIVHWDVLAWHTPDPDSGETGNEVDVRFLASDANGWLHVGWIRFRAAEATHGWKILTKPDVQSQRIF